VLGGALTCPLVLIRPSEGVKRVMRRVNPHEKPAALALKRH